MIKPIIAVVINTNGFKSIAIFNFKNAAFTINNPLPKVVKALVINTIALVNAATVNNTGPIVVAIPAIINIVFFVAGDNALNFSVRFCINTINCFVFSFKSNAVTISVPNSASAIFKLSLNVEPKPLKVWLKVPIPLWNLPPSVVAS